MCWRAWGCGRGREMYAVAYGGGMGMTGEDGTPWGMLGLLVTFATLVVSALAAVPLWVPFLEERPHLTARIRGPLGWLGRWWRVVLGMVVLATVGYVTWTWAAVRVGGWIGVSGFLLWWFRGELGTSIGRFHRWALWRVVVRPARDRFGVEAWEDADGLGASLIDVLRPKLRDLADEDLTVLARALSRRKPGSGEVWVEWPTVRLDPPAAGKAEAKTRFCDALENLRAAGFATEWSLVEMKESRNLDFRIQFPIADWGTLERLYVLAEVELGRRAACREMKRTAPVVKPTQPSKKEQACRAKIGELSIVAAGVLHHLLGEYVHYAGETLHVWLDDPEVLMSPLKDLRRDLLKSACNELVRAGFLAEVVWGERDGGEEMYVVVGKCMVKRSAARRVAGWVDEEMRGQGEWGPF